MSVESKDHAYPNAGGASAVTASVGGITNGEGAAVGDILKRDEDKGAAVHVFEPDADPVRKAALAGAAKAQLDALPKLGRRKVQAEADAGLALGVDTSGVKGKGEMPIPTVTVSDADATSRGEGQMAGGDTIPGSIPTGAAPAVPTWMETGWRQVAKLNADAMDPRKQEDASILTEYMSEAMYGAWYHNAGIIIFAVFATRFITAIGLGFAWILIILAFCAAYYSLSIRRTRHRARDDIQRELVKTRLVTETESADWLNEFLDRFWLIYEPVLSQTIVASVDSVLASSTPAFLESIRMTTFTLGTKAPRIDFVRTFPKTPEDIVTMDWALSFTPNDLMDITPRQAQRRVNPKIVLSIRIGKGGISKAIPILLEDMSFSGKMRIKLKLMTNFPHIKSIDMSFIDKPTFDYVLKPLGGETFGFDINNIPGLAPFIREQVHANLGPMMYDPNSFTIDLESLLSGTPLDSAIGVLKVSINDARGLKAVKFGGGDPDPYVTIALGAKPVICKTKTVNSTSNPTWHDTQFILVNTLADVLNLGLWDYNEHRADSQLGTVSQELAVLHDDAEKDGLVGTIISGGRERGELRYDLSFFPVLQPVKNPDGTFEPPTETSTGIVRLTLHQAKDLDITRAHGDLNPFARVFLGASKQPVHKTPILKRQNQPIWESHCEFLVPDKHSSIVSVEVIDSKDFATDPILGRLTIKLSDLLEMKERGQDWLPMQQSRAGKIRLTAAWKPVAMTGSISGASAYIPPIGILRIWLKRATDVKNVEGGLGGKSDPYVRVLGNNKVLARTEVQNNNLNPEWDQIVYVPVHNLRENIVLEVMDYENIGKDRSLGYAELKVAECVEANPGVDANIYPFVSKGNQLRNDKIKLDKANTYKGTLVYEVDFKPAMSLRGGVSFEAEGNELEEAARKRAARDARGSTADGSGGESIRTVKTQVSKSSLKEPTIPEGAVPIPAAIGDGKGRVSESGELESRGGGEATAAEDPQVGISLSTDELLAKQSGVLVFQLISGDLARRGSVEVTIDENYWPSFTSTKSRSHHQKWDQIGEGLIRELEWSKISLRINANEESERDETFAEYSCETKSFLDACMTSPADFHLTRADGANPCTLRFSARYVPIDIKLEARETHNNMGLLKCDVLRAKNLLAVDRGGKSDPYITFHLNGKREFKSEVLKKTLNPEWNESFDCAILSRVSAKLEYEIFDWDRVGSADSLGGGKIDLTALEPFEKTELTLPVVHKQKGEHGTLTVRLMFQPDLIARTRNKTSTFSTAGRAITTVGGLPIAAGKGVITGGGAVAMGVGRGAMGVGRGVGSVGGFAGRKIGLIKKKDKTGREVLMHPDDIAEDGSFDAYTDPGAQVDGYVAGEVSGTGARPTEAGTLVVTVLGGSGIKSEEGAKLKSYVAVKMGGKSHKTDHVKGVEPEWNEHLSFQTTPDVNSLTVTLHEHHSFGRDPVIGESEVNIWQHINAAVPTADVAVLLSSGAGTIKLRLDWTTGPAPSTPSLGGGGLLSRRKSISSGLNADGAMSSPSRLGGLRMSMSKRDKEIKADDT